jgi:hypothetical protein
VSHPTRLESSSTPLQKAQILQTSQFGENNLYTEAGAPLNPHILAYA